MNRAEKVAMAQRLLAWRDSYGLGLTFREIGERMGGAATQTVSDWINDPDGSKLRARKETYRGACIVCGAPTNGSDGPNRRLRRCAKCAAVEAARRHRERSDKHRAVVERMWAEGKTCREIGKVLGWTANNPANNITRLRASGYDLPYRNQGSARWANADGNGARHLALARAAQGRGT